MQMGWDDKAHKVFVRLCVNKVSKGNRPNTSLSKVGWENVQAGLQKELKVDYTLKQL